MADPSGDAETPDAEVDEAEFDDDEEELIGSALLGEFDPSGDDSSDGADEEPEAGDAVHEASEGGPSVDEASADEDSADEAGADKSSGTSSESLPEMPEATRKGRSPFVLIMVPLLILIGLAIGFRSFASAQRSEANAAIEAAQADGSEVELCEGAEGELSLEGFSVEQPLVLSSLRLDRAAVSFVAPAAEVETDVASDGADADEPMVDVIELDLERQSPGWCISSWDTSTRLASN